MTTRRPPTEALIAELEARDLRLRGRRTADVPELANFRFHFRRRFYRLADFFFAASIFHLICLGALDGFGHWTALAGFTGSFTMMFFCEFRARRLTRQLARRAAEQLARDILGMRE